MKRDASIGVSVSATSNDTETEKTMVSPYWIRNCPTIPSITEIGTNTANVANVPARTASATRRVAEAAASGGLRPASMSRSTASTTTMAISYYVASTTGRVANINKNTPMAWADTDELRFAFTYEAA